MNADEYALLRMAPSSHARITAGELAVVLSHYDLGVIEAVRRFKGGSRQSPKIVIETPGRRYLLKRRPPGGSATSPAIMSPAANSPPDPGTAPGAAANDAARIAFTHEVVLHLARHGFPVPELLGTRHGNSMLELATGVYELYRFVDGSRYARRTDQAFAAGWCQGRCHELLGDLKTTFPAPRRSFHAHPKIEPKLGQIAQVLETAETQNVCRGLADAYRHAAARATEQGAGDGPTQIVHGDWHPGNMLFREAPHLSRTAQAVEGAAHRDLVAGVFDFDAARHGSPIHDLANGAMQFAVHRHVTPEPGEAAMPAGGSQWRIALDPNLLRAFFAGYAGARGPIGVRGRQAIPWLMVQALIVEVVVPIGATGAFGKLPAAQVLGVVLRAVEAMAAQADRLALLADEPYH